MSEKAKYLQVIDEKANIITDVSDKIWEYAELSLMEFKSCELYVKVLKEQGFNVECPVCGIDTIQFCFFCRVLYLLSAGCLYRYDRRHHRETDEHAIHFWFRSGFCCGLRICGCYRNHRFVSGLYSGMVMDLDWNHCIYKGC